MPLIDGQGTPDFMAVEIRDRKYRFLERKTLIRDVKKKKSRPRGPIPVLRYNTLHDLESTWWIALWMLFFKSPLTGISLPPAHTDNRDACFPRDHYSYGYREDILIDGFEDDLEYLPESLKFLGDLLEEARMILTLYYPKAERKRPVAVARWWRVHEFMGGVFDRIIEKSGDVDTLWAEAAEITGKRPAKILDNGPDFVGASCVDVDHPRTSSVDADHPRKRHNAGSMAPPSLHKSVRSQFSTKTSSQKHGRRTPGSIVEPAYTRSHGPPSSSTHKSD